MSEINVMKLHKELEAGGLPVIGVCVDGRVDYSRELSQVELLTAAQVIDAHNPEEIPCPTMEERLQALEDALLALIVGV